MFSNNKSSFFISPFIVLIFCLGMALMFIKPKAEEIFQLRDNITAETERIVRLTEKENFLRSLNETALSDDLKILETALPSDKDVPSFMSTVNLLATEASISVTTISLSPGKISTDTAKVNRGEKLIASDENATKLPINLTIEGSYDSVKNFITRMARAMPLQTVQSINFTRTADKEGIFGLLSSKFFLSIHYKLMPKTIGKISDPLEEITKEEENLLSELVNYTKPSYVKNFIPVGREDPFTIQ